MHRDTQNQLTLNKFSAPAAHKATPSLDSHHTLYSSTAIVTSHSTQSTVSILQRTYVCGNNIYTHTYIHVQCVRYKLKIYIIGIRLRVANLQKCQHKHTTHTHATLYCREGCNEMKMQEHCCGNLLLYLRNNVKRQHAHCTL